MAQELRSRKTSVFTPCWILNIGSARQELFERFKILKSNCPIKIVDNMILREVIQRNTCDIYIERFMFCSPSTRYELKVQRDARLAFNLLTEYVHLSGHSNNRSVCLLPVRGKKLHTAENGFSCWFVQP